MAESNNGGNLVEVNLRTVAVNVPYLAVHAAQGKRTRAEPVAALYEQGKVHHVGLHAQLEDQLTTWDPLSSTKSPDRLDALVWALSDLLLRPRERHIPTVGVRVITGDEEEEAGASTPTRCQRKNTTNGFQCRRDAAPGQTWCKDCLTCDEDPRSDGFDD